MHELISSMIIQVYYLIYQWKGKGRYWGFVCQFFLCRVFTFGRRSCGSLIGGKKEWGSDERGWEVLWSIKLNVIFKLLSIQRSLKHLRQSATGAGFHIPFPQGTHCYSTNSRVLSTLWAIEQSLTCKNVISLIL